MRVHHLNNVSRALAVLEDNKVKLVNISNEHIVDGSAKLTLGLVWAVILHWQVCLGVERVGLGVFGGVWVCLGVERKCLGVF